MKSAPAEKQICFSLWTPVIKIQALNSLRQILLQYKDRNGRKTACKGGTHSAGNTYSVTFGYAYACSSQGVFQQPCVGVRQFNLVAT